MAPSSLSYSTLKSLAMQEGIDIISVTHPERCHEDESRLSYWQERGFAGEMKYMNRTSELLANPRALMQEAQSVIVCLISYQSTPHPERPSGFGRVARYAWGMDYHTVLPNRLRNLVKRITEECNISLTFKIFSDSVPLLERALAKRAGAGFIGRNTMLIRPKIGSYFFIAEIITDIEIKDYGPPLIYGSCGSCKRCRPTCPTQAIVADYQLDARRCISYLSIEKRGALTHWEREALSEWIFGCDICQDICPFNHAAQKKDNMPTIEKLSYSFGNGPLLSLSEVFSIKSNSEFMRRFTGTPLTRPGRVGLIRNALCVAANTLTEELSDHIIYLFKSDNSPIIRQHALWAIFKIASACNNIAKENLCCLIERALQDMDVNVRDEALQLSKQLYG